MAAILGGAVIVADTPVALAREIYPLNLNDATSYVLTPQKIKAITNVYLTPTNAAGSGANALYAAWTGGANTVTVTGVNNATCVVEVVGVVC